MKNEKRNSITYGGINVGDLKKKKGTIKCTKCPLGKKIIKKEVNLLDRRLNEIDGSKNSPFLIVMARPESDYMMGQFKKILESQGIYDYVIAYGVACAITEMKDVLKHPLYTYCNNINLNDFPNIKAIATLGTGHLAFTKNSDLPSWEELKEFQFNQTYFFPAIGEKQVPIYPLPYIDLIQDSGFEKTFTIQIQLQEIKKRLGLK